MVYNGSYRYHFFDHSWSYVCMRTLSTSMGESALLRDGRVEEAKDSAGSPKLRNCLVSSFFAEEV